MVAHIFTLLLAPFASKFVNYSRHSESLKNDRKSSNCCFQRKMSSILNSSENLKSHCTTVEVNALKASASETKTLFTKIWYISYHDSTLVTDQKNTISKIDKICQKVISYISKTLCFDDSSFHIILKAAQTKFYVSKLWKVLKNICKKKEKIEYLFDYSFGQNPAILVKSNIFGILESRAFRWHASS